jgi:hypothetical protein
MAGMRACFDRTALIICQWRSDYLHFLGINMEILLTHYSIITSSRCVTTISPEKLGNTTTKGAQKAHWKIVLWHVCLVQLQRDIYSLKKERRPLLCPRFQSTVFWRSQVIYLLQSLGPLQRSFDHILTLRSRRQRSQVNSLKVMCIIAYIKGRLHHINCLMMFGLADWIITIY